MTKMTKPHIITNSNLSLAWAEALLHVLDGAEDSLIVALRDLDGNLPQQDSEIAVELDRLLTEHQIPRIAHTALTIVPYESWIRRGRCEIEDLASWYMSFLYPRLKARCSKNSHGTYFQRLVAYTGVKNNGTKLEIREINQIAYLINFWRKREEKGGRPRQSALQLSCFDPAKDDNGSPLAGFPCLQQISFTYHESGSLEMTSYYPTQYIFDRAYGNYLGLCQLGHMIAHLIGVKFTRFTCITARPEIGNLPKEPKFREMLRERVSSSLSK